MDIGLFKDMERLKEARLKLARKIDKKNKKP